MSIHFHCPSCGNRLDVSEHLAGTASRCHHCHQTLAVPGSGQTVETLAVGGSTPDNSESLFDSRGVLVAGLIAGVAISAVTATMAYRIARGPAVPQALSQYSTLANRANLPKAPIATPKATTRYGFASRGDKAAAEPVNSLSPFASSAEPAKAVASPGFADATGSNLPLTNASPTTGTSALPANFGAPDEVAPPGETGRADSSASSSEAADIDPPAEGTTSLNAAPQLGAWTARPDPPPQPMEVKPGKLSLKLGSFGEVIFPRQISNFALAKAGIGDSTYFVVADLRTGKPIGKPLEHVELGKPLSFSPDGRYVAGWKQVDKQLNLEVWSFVTGEKAATLSVTPSFEKTVFFLRPHEIGVVESPGNSELQVRLWNIQTEQELHTIPITDSERRIFPLRGESFAVSHGGKYMAVLLDKQLQLYDLTTGEKAGGAVLPQEPRVAHGIAFSPDGRELAALIEIESGAQLLIWNCETGELALDHAYQESLSHIWYDGPGVEWMPDGSGLIYRGHVLADRQTGREIWNLPTTTSAPRRMSRPNQILAVVRDPKEGGEALMGLELPVAEIAKATELIRGGGKVIDSMLPPLTTAATATEATRISAPSSPPTWSVERDALGAPPQAIPTSDIPVGPEGSKVLELKMAAPEVAKAIVYKELETPRKAGRATGKQVVLERYDLLTGERQGQLPIVSVYQFLDISRSGKVALMGVPHKDGGYDRLDVVSIEPKAHVAGWRPYQNESDKNLRHVTWAIMQDETHVLTGNGAGKLIRWKMPECTADYVFEEFGEVLATSPNRIYLLALQGNALRVYDAATGNCRGELQLAEGAKAVRASFRSDGSELVALLDGPSNKLLARWTVDDGKLITTFPVPAEILRQAHFHSFRDQRGELAWLDDRYVLLDNSFLIDIKNRAVVWRYHPAPWTGKFVADSPNGRQWIVGPRGGPFGPQHLASVKLPSTAARPRIENLKLEDQLLLQPGTRVRLHVQLHGTYANMNESVSQTVAERLKEKQVEIDPAAPLTFSITSGQRATGMQLSISSNSYHNPFARPDPSDPTFAQQELYCELAIYDAANQLIWKTNTGIAMRSSGSIDQQSNAEAVLRGEMEQGFMAMLSSGDFAKTSFPQHMFPALDVLLGGQSTLGINGEEPLPARQQ